MVSPATSRFGFGGAATDKKETFLMRDRKVRVKGTWGSGQGSQEQLGCCGEHQVGGQMTGLLVSPLLGCV